MIDMIKNFLKAPHPPQAGVVAGEFYKRTGACNQCGKCCSNIYLIHGEETITSLEQFERLKPFNPEYAYFTPMDETEHGLLFQCKHLQPDKSCGIYADRPLFCRRYPSEMSLLMGGTLAEGCGYQFEPIVTFQEVLAQELKKIS